MHVRACVCVCVCVCVCACAQSCLTLCHPVDSSLSGSSVHGILKARILEWAAIPFARGSSQPSDQIQSLLSPELAGGFFTSVPSPGMEYQREMLKISQYLRKKEHQRRETFVQFKLLVEIITRK